LNVLNFFRPRKSASVARERLQILLSHERNGGGSRPDLLAILREEILAVVGRHVEIDSDRVRVVTNRGPLMSTLEIDIEIPNMSRAKIAVNM
jgi:cell division topological specificity factor